MCYYHQGQLLHLHYIQRTSGLYGDLKTVLQWQKLYAHENIIANISHFFTPLKFLNRGHIEPVAIQLYVQKILNVRRNLPALQNDKLKQIKIKQSLEKCFFLLLLQIILRMAPTIPI